MDTFIVVDNLDNCRKIANETKVRGNIVYQCEPTVTLTSLTWTSVPVKYGLDFHEPVYAAATGGHGDEKNTNITHLSNLHW